MAQIRRPHLSRRLASALLALACAVAAVAPLAAVQVPHDVVVSANPVDHTPHVLDGRVLAVQPVGGRVIVGGSFQQIRAASDETVLTRPNLFAFDAATGAIDHGFAPSIDGDVETIGMSADGRAVFVGGSFSSVDGQPHRRLVKLDAVTGAVDESFSARPDSKVRDLVVAGDRVFLGGTFTTVNGEPRPAFAAVDATTGEVDTAVKLGFSGPFGGGTLNVIKLDVTPDHTQVVAIGNFGFVDGHPRPQIALIDVGFGEARLADWHTDRYAQVDADGNSWCSGAFDTYMRDVDIAPDGSYMVVVTTGAYHSGRLCDTAARWELGATGTALAPTWVDYTGGDTLYSAGVTGEAVYVGGHQRWMNNSFAGDTPGPGAVSREGIAALDPINGLPLSWNPGRTRGVGAFELVSTPEGLYVGSDTDRIGNYEYHGRIAMFPTASGAPIPPAAPGPLPGHLISGAGATARSTPFDGTAVGTAEAVTGIDWSTVGDGMVLSGQLYTAESDGALRVRPFDGRTAGTPTALDLNGLTATEFPVASLTGMTFDQVTGRLYYTVNGHDQLYWRWFTPESGVVGADTFTAATTDAGLDWRTVTGLHLHGGTLYHTTTDGNLRRIGLTGGTVQPGTAAVVSGPAAGDGQTWGRGLTLHSPAGYAAPNLPPEPRIRVACDGDTCSFGSTGSRDRDGVLRTFTWDFGDGTTAQAPGAVHTFGDGRFTVTLTVTDDQGASASTTVPITFSQPPVAELSVACVHLTCDMDASASSDGGQIVAYAWDLGDGTTAEGVAPSHTYAAAGTYPITLTVTDDEGMTATTTAEVAVSEPAEEVTFLGADAVNGNLTAFSVEVPDEVQPGDLLLLFASFNSASGDPQPQDLPGWTRIDRVTTSAMQTSAWWRVAEPGDEQRRETLTSASLVKGDVALLAYQGTSTSTPVPVAAGAAESVYRADHTTPQVQTGLADGAVVSYWSDRTSGTTSWTVPADQAVRHMGIGSGGGRVSGVATDAALPGPSTVGGLVATASTANSNATMWTLVLAPAGVDEATNRQPIAEVAASCIDLTCTFDGSPSSDVDGTVIAHDWAFGDGTVGSGATTSHAYSAPGTYDVTLVVTDDDGGQGTAVVQVTVSAPPAAVAFVGADGVNAAASQFAVAVPAGTSVGDAMLLAVTSNVDSVQATPPAGWTSLGRIVDDSMVSEVFWRVAEDADIGSTVGVTTSGFAKSDVTLGVWTGTALAQPIAAAAAAAEDQVRAEHATPVVDNPVEGGVLVSYWADKSSATTSITPPADHVARRQATGGGGGRITALLGEGGPRAAGPVGGAVGTADSANGKATTWSIVLTPR